jgi:hypothetical protein
MLSVTNKPFMLSVFMLNVIMLIVVMLSVTNKPFMMSVTNKRFMLSVVMLNVVAPILCLQVTQLYLAENFLCLCLLLKIKYCEYSPMGHIHIILFSS